MAKPHDEDDKRLDRFMSYPGQYVVELPGDHPNNEDDTTKKPTPGVHRATDSGSDADPAD